MCKVCKGLCRTVESNGVKRAFKRILAGYKSLPAIVVRAIIATLLGTGDLVSDVYTTVTLFSLSHLRPAYAMVGMICASMAVQVRAVFALYPGLRRCARLAGACLWPHLWVCRRHWPSS